MMNMELMILIILFILALAGGAAILNQLVFGFRKTNLNDNYVWGIYVQGCFFLSSLAAGMLIAIASLVILGGESALAAPFGGGTIGDFLEMGSAWAFAFLLGSQLLLGIDLGKPLRAVLMVKSKNFHSPLTWDFYTLGLSTVLSLVLFLGVLPGNRGVMLIWSLLTLVAASLCLAIHTIFFLSRAKAGFQASAFSGLESLLASLLGGVGALILVLPFSGVTLSLTAPMLILATLLLATDFARKIAQLKDDRHGGDKPVLALNVLVILLLIAGQMTGSQVPALLAGAAAIILLFIEKLNTVILPQRENIIPAPYSQFHDKTPYRPSGKEISVLIGSFAICAFVGYGILYLKVLF